jgi:serine protease
MKTVYYRLAFLLFFVFSGCVIQAQQSHSSAEAHFTLPPGAEYLPGRILFKLLPEHSHQQPGTIASLAHRMKNLKVSTISKPFKLREGAQKRSDQPDIGAIYEVFFPESIDMVHAVNELLASGALEYAEPRYIYRTFVVPNDVYADTTLPLDFMYHLGQIRAYEAWDISKGDTSIVIGISDSGISFDHVDLKKNLARNLGDPIDGIDNDNDGYTDNYRGWDFSGVLGKQGDNDPSVPCAVGECVHGMPVAGLAAADTDNGIGVSGVGFNCRFLPLKASPDSLPDGITHGYESILYAAQQGAQIVNCSWGGQTNSKVGADLVKYVHLTYQTGIIAACGNTPRDIKFYPASYPEVLSVANVHQGDSICCPPFLSSTHNFEVDVAAPGWELYSTVNLTDYGPFSGTSASSPVVAGAAGIVMAHFPNYTGFQAGQRLRVTTDEIYQNPYNFPYLEKLGTGRINLYRALTDPLKPSIRLEEHSFSPNPDEEAILPIQKFTISGSFVNHLDPSSSQLEISLEVMGNAANYITVANPVWNPGVMLENESKSPASPFTLVVGANAPENLIVTLRFRYLDTTHQYDDFEYLTLTINPTYVDVKQNRLFTSISSLGNIGYPTESFMAPGLGVQHRPNEQSAIGDAGFMYTSGGKLADNLRGPFGSRTGKWFTVETIRKDKHPLAPYYASGIMEDDASLDTRVKQEVFAWDDQASDEFVIVRYRIYNRSATGISDGYAGILADWQIFEPSINAADFDGGNEIVYSYDRLNADPTHYGICLVDGGRFRAFAEEKINYPGTTASKIAALQSPPSTVNARVGTGGNAADVIQAIAAGPLVIPPGDSMDVVFALLAGEDLADLRRKATAARERYACYLAGQGPDNGFTAPSGSVLVGNQVSFQDLNTTGSQWTWDFGDGNSSTQQNPSHSYQHPGNYLVSMTVSDGTCSVTQKQTLTVRRAVSMEQEFNDFPVSAYPNPAKDHLQVEWEAAGTGETHIELINPLGQTIQHFSERGDRLGINLSDIASGIYFLKILQGEMVSTEKIVIKR